MVIAGFEIPSDSLVFLAILVVHVPIGVLAVVTGVAAMLKEKRRGAHTRFGSIYFFCLGLLFVTSAALSAMRWSEDYHLFYSWSGRLFGGGHWSPRAPAQMENADRSPHCPDGNFVNRDAHRVLRRQWKEPACLEKPAACRLLASAGCCGSSGNLLGTQS